MEIPVPSVGEDTGVAGTGDFAFGGMFSAVGVDI
jgi:hypothetical protein